MTPEQALAEIGNLTDGARVVAVLAGGPASDSFLVERGADRWVLRLDRQAAVALALDRASEAVVLAHVYSHGLGPLLEFADVEQGIQLVRFIPGRAWSGADLEDAANIAGLARLLRQLHGLTPAGRPFALGDKIERYAAAVGTSAAAALADEAQGILHNLNTTAACLCHNDLVCANIVAGDRLYLIDWEYSAPGDPFFDLATVVEHHGLSGDLARRLLRDYLGDVTDADRERLELWRQVYRCLMPLWQAFVDRT